MVSLHMVLLLPAKPPRFLLQDDASNSCLVSGVSLMPSLRPPRAVLPFHSQISLLLLYYIIFIWKCLLSLGAPLCAAGLFGGGFPLSLSTLSNDNLRLITSSQNGRWSSCPAVSLRWQTEGRKLMGCISIERFLEPKMGSDLLAHVAKGAEFHLPPALSWPV